MKETIKRSAVLHRPMSEYAHGLDENRILIRIRTARDNIKVCKLFYGDTACRSNPIKFYELDMKVVASDLEFDYFEAVIESKINRIYYYFELSSVDESSYYFSDFFRNDLPIDRSEYYKLPFNHRADIVRTPDWVKDAVIYNIFPDSFSTDENGISGKGVTLKYKSDNMKTPQTVSSRLGGTFKGIEKKLPYLEHLGINCIYLNPIFAAGEYHKYDLIDYMSVDPCFGTNEEFRDLVDACHKRDIRVIIDGVFNHCGWKFFAFEDVVEKGVDSEYADWFYDLTFPVVRPDDPEDYPTYACFAYERMMPKLNTTNPKVRDYLVNVGRHWVEEYNIDGWRLDVASEINDDFWRDFRRAVKSVNPNAFIIGEVWESASHWMQGDMFDSTMNYDLRKFCSYFFAERKISAETFEAGVTNMLLRYRKDMQYGQLNLLDSHDVSRFLSVCDGNVNRYKMAVMFQMLFVGAPSIFYGDEQGIEGIDELDFRKGMTFDESNLLFEFYKDAISVRKSYTCIRRGEYQTLYSKNGIYALSRFVDDERIVAIFNNSDNELGIEKIDSILGINHDDAEVILSNRYGDKLERDGFAVFEIH